VTHIIPKQKACHFCRLWKVNQALPSWTSIIAWSKITLSIQKKWEDDPERDPPFFFGKMTSLCCFLLVFSDDGPVFPIPMASSQFEYEVELVML